MSSWKISYLHITQHETQVILYMPESYKVYNLIYLLSKKYRHFVLVNIIKSTSEFSRTPQNL